MPHPFRRMAERGVTAGLRAKLRIRGYSKEQAARMVAGLDRKKIKGTLSDAWAKWGPTVIAIVKAIIALLPMLLMLEKPELPPVTDPLMMDMIELDEGHDAENNPFVFDGRDEDGEKDVPKKKAAFTAMSMGFTGGEGSPEPGGDKEDSDDECRDECADKCTSEAKPALCGYCVLFNTVDGKQGFVGPMESQGWAQDVAGKLAEKRPDVINIVVCRAKDSAVKAALERIGG